MLADTGRWKPLHNEVQDLAVDECVSNSVSPGRLIAQERIRQGLTVDQLATRTKIARGLLEALEADEYEKLAGPVFVKGFLRCCARTLRMDEDRLFALLHDQERASIRARRRSLLGIAEVDETPASPRLSAEESLVAAIARSQPEPASDSSPKRARVGKVSASSGPTGVRAGVVFSSARTRSSTTSPLVSPAATAVREPAYFTRLTDRMPGLDSVRDLAEVSRAVVVRVVPAHLAMWAAVSLLVAAIVFIAFNLASAHQTVELMRS